MPSLFVHINGSYPRTLSITSMPYRTQGIVIVVRNASVLSSLGASISIDFSSGPTQAIEESKSSILFDMKGLRVFERISTLIYLLEADFPSRQNQKFLRQKLRILYE